MEPIDVSRYITEIERELRALSPRRSEMLAVLERWQWDERLDDASRATARRLLVEFRVATR